MLDKKVPYAGLYMRRAPGTPVPAFPLPDGFRFSFYEDGDELEWARIEASVLEFSSEFAALLFFKEKFMPHADELRRRCLFIEDGGGKVATANAWWSDIEGGRRAWLQWVGVDPQYQGLGLGKALISRATGLMVELYGDVPVFLKTQTWSYKAIAIYQECGYRPTDEKALYGSRKDNYKKALRILKKLPRYTRKVLSTSSITI